jgi:hypothetical protein
VNSPLKHSDDRAGDGFPITQTADRNYAGTSFVVNAKVQNVTVEVAAGKADCADGTPLNAAMATKRETRLVDDKWPI